MGRRNYLKNDRGDLSARRRTLLTVAAAAVGCYLLASFILGEMGVVKFFRMQAQFRSLEADISRLKQENTRLLRDVRALRSDAAVIERVARDKLGLARPGEIVYYYDAEHPTGDGD